LPKNEWKLVDVPDMGYLSTDNPPRGELAVRTPYMASGYLNRQEETQESFDDEGFFHTGDIVELTGAPTRLFSDQEVPVTRIRLLDRRKNFFKMAQSVFVAPDALENILIESTFCDQLFIHGDIQHSVLVCVCVPGNSAAEVTEADLLADFGRIGRERGLRSFEVPKAVFIERDVVFSAENGLLTPSWKPCRPALRRHYAQILEDMFQQVESTAADTDRVSTEPQFDDSTASRLLKLLSRASGRGIESIIAESPEKVMLRDLCVDSLSAVRLSRGIQEAFSGADKKVHVPVSFIFDPTESFKSLCSLVETQLAGEGASGPAAFAQSEPSSDDLLAHLLQAGQQLAANVDRLTLQASADSLGLVQTFDGIFLTGVTGFVGSHLLHELLGRTDRTVFCLVRASDAAQAKIRTVRSLREFDLEEDAELVGSRVIPVAGNLERPLFGLSESEFHDLSLRCSDGDTFHCGAWVNTVLPHAELSGANVDGTRTSLELTILASQYAALRGKAGPRRSRFHHVSTLSVLRHRRPAEQLVVDVAAAGHGGYGTSKWVSDRLVVDEAPKYNLGANVFRLGSVSAHSQTGTANRVDYQTRFISSLVLQRTFPLAEGSFMQFAPVDAICRAMVVVAMARTEPSCSAFHFTNPQTQPTVATVGTWIAEHVEDRGFKMIGLAEDEWISNLRRDVSSGSAVPVHEQNPLEPLLGYFDSGRIPSESTLPPSESFRATLAAANAEADFPGWPVIDSAYIARLIDWLFSKGAFPNEA
jgi:fatty acid CoA ligase FadD9